MNKPFTTLAFAIVLAPASAVATITDFNNWTLVEDPPNANMSASVDSATQVTLNATGLVPNATDIGYQSVNGNTPATSTAGDAFDPTASFSIAVDYDWSLVNAMGGTGIGFGIGEDGAGENSAGIALVGTNGAVFGTGAAARINNADTLTPIALGGGTSGSFIVEYDAVTGDILVGTGVVGSSTAGAVTFAVLPGADVYDLWNADGDDDLLLASFFLRSQDGIAPALTSGSTTAVFSNFRVFEGSAVEVPEPSSLALLSLGGLLVTCRRR